MAIYEMRTYTLIVGKMADVVQLYKTEGWPALQKHPNKLVGYFTGDIGAEIDEQLYAAVAAVRPSCACGSIPCPT